MAQSHASPAVVAQRMSDLLQRFPSAAIGGVQWRTLTQKYEEEHHYALDVEGLGHSSALAAATALLWDVIRIVESSDTDNPVVAVDDAIAMTPAPGSLASWPSLYKVLCDIACKHGSPLIDEESGKSKTRHAVLLSQVKPLLKDHWHSSFDEFAIYFTEEGSQCKLKKMKHLLQALLRWREARLNWRTSCADNAKDRSRSIRSAVDTAVAMELTLVPSKKHNDLLLCCECSETSTDTVAAPVVLQQPLTVPVQVPVVLADAWKPQLPDDFGEAPFSAGASDSTEDPELLSPGRLSSSSVGSERLAQEVRNTTSLEEENRLLRSENAKLEQLLLAKNDVAAHSNVQPQQLLPTKMLDQDLDDPFEPPPQFSRWDASPVCSTPGSFSFGSGTLTPFSESSMSCTASGYATPVVAPPAGQMCNGVTLVPVWFQTIPTGVVQQARAMFEQHAAIPSWFAQQ